MVTNEQRGEKGRRVLGLYVSEKDNIDLLDMVVDDVQAAVIDLMTDIAHWYLKAFGVKPGFEKIARCAERHLGQEIQDEARLDYLKKGESDGS